VYVCSCHGVDDDEVRVSIRAGADSVESIAARCGAGSDCGSCRPTIESLLVETIAMEASAA
jgi:bacterioferritin-associated ferredoxin